MSGWPDCGPRLALGPDDRIAQAVSPLLESLTLGLWPAVVAGATLYFAPLGVGVASHRLTPGPQLAVAYQLFLRLNVLISEMLSFKKSR